MIIRSSLPFLSLTGNDCLMCHSSYRVSDVWWGGFRLILYKEIGLCPPCTWDTSHKWGDSNFSVGWEAEVEEETFRPDPPPKWDFIPFQRRVRLRHLFATHPPLGFQWWVRFHRTPHTPPPTEMGITPYGLCPMCTVHRWAKINFLQY